MHRIWRAAFSARYMLLTSRGGAWCAPTDRWPRAKSNDAGWSAKACLPTLVMIIAGAGIYSMVYFVTFFVQQVMHFDPIKTGFSFLPLSIIIVTASQAMTKLLPRYGPKPLVTIGTALLATGLLFWHFAINANSGYWDSIFPGLVIAALGVGFIFVPMTITAVSGVRDTDAGVASATLNVGQQVGGSIGLAVLATAAAIASRNGTSSTIAALKIRVHAGQLPTNVIAHVRDLIAARSGATPTTAALHDGRALHAVAQIQAHSTDAGFLVGGIIALVAVVVALTTITGKHPAQPRRNPVRASTNTPSKATT